MNEAGFATPLALLAVLAVIPLLGMWWYEARGARYAEAAYGGSDALRLGRSRVRTRLRRGLLVTVVILTAIAIARPQWGSTPSPVERQGIDVVIALDISRSMQATDVQPSRAGLAAAGLEEMLRHLGGDRVGLVTFAGTAFARSPLTLDVEAITDLVHRAQREGALVGPGTDVGAAITTALRLLEIPDKAKTRAIILISDGEDLGRSLDEAVSAARRGNVRIYTVAAGTEAGALVPLGEGTRGDTPNVPQVTSRADRNGLARIAGDTGGSARDVAAVAGLAVELARLQQSSLDEGEQVIPIERLQWPLLAAAALLLVHMLIPEAARSARPARTGRSGLVRRLGLAGALLASLITGCGGTEVWRKVDEGNRLYAEGQFAPALGAYAAAKQLDSTDPIVDYDIGNTLHRLDRLDDAIAASKAAATNTRDGRLYAHATYAAASSAFRRGSLVEARDGFVAVLQRDPTDTDARHNLEVVLRAIGRNSQEQQPQPQQGQQGQQPSATPPAGQPGQGQPGQGQPQGTATPGPGQPSPSQPQPGGPAQPGTGRPGTGPGQPVPGTPEAERVADEALRRALDDLPADVTPEQALEILDAARTASEAGTLRRSGGATPDPNDR